MIHYDENIYTDRIIAIENARRNIYEDSLKFDLSPLWRNWSIGGLSKRVMTELGLTEISGDPRWNYMLDNNILAVYSDKLERIWIVENFYGKTNMRLMASGICDFEKMVFNHYNSLKAA
jgi:hypothetical protein